MAGVTLPPVEGATSPTPQVQYPPIGAVTYPPIRGGLSVADFLDTSQPLVKSKKPPTQAMAPKFIDEEETERRRLARGERRVLNAVATSRIAGQRVNERRYLKAQYEFEREKRLAERVIYHKEKTTEWRTRLHNSPFLVDLAGDGERVEEEMYVREHEERRRRQKLEKRKKKVKNEIIVKALAEVPVLEQARKEKRMFLEQEKRKRALCDVRKAERVAEQKLIHSQKLEDTRQKHLEERTMMDKDKGRNSPTKSPTK